MSEMLARARLIDLQVHTDERGRLVVSEFPTSLPFLVKRMFYISNVPQGEVRGTHAHLECHQFILCVSGSVKAMIDDGDTHEVFTLAAGGSGLYMPPLTWGRQFDYSEDAVLLVLTSHQYSEQDYIHDYEEFIKIVKFA